MKKLTAIRIDAYINRIEEIQIDGTDFEEINTAIGCDIFCIGARLTTGDILFVDDMGWLDTKVTRAFKMGGDNTVLPKDALFAGNGLILGVSASGNSLSAKTKLLDAANAVEFLPPGWQVTPAMRELAMSATKIFTTHIP